jgi:hypothetical protein
MPIDGFRNRGFYVVEYHKTNISAVDLTLRNCQQIETTQRIRKEGDLGGVRGFSLPAHFYYPFWLVSSCSKG